MHPALRDHRRYLAALTAAAAGEPLTHANQLAALAREAAVAAAAADPAACRAASGDLFEYARGAWLDRLLAHARIATAMDDPWTTQAMALEFEAALAARDHRDWGEQLARGSAAGAPWHDRATVARSAPGAVFAAAMTLGWDRRAGARAEALEALVAQVAAWSEVQRLPATGDVTRWARLFARPRYALGWPWLEGGLGAAAAIVAAVVSPPPALAPVEVGSASMTLAAMEEQARRWRAGLAEARPGPVAGDEPTAAGLRAAYAPLATLPGDDPVVSALRAAAQALLAEGGDVETAQGLLAVWTERDLLADLAAAPVRADAHATLARTAVWPDPIRAAGARALLADLSGVRTGCEVDLVSMFHGACARHEATWTRAFADGALAPIAAACLAGCDPAAAGGAAAAWPLARALVGADPGYLDWPLCAEVVAAMARPATEGAALGEFGHAIAGDARAWFAVTGRAAVGPADVREALRASWGQVAVAIPGALRLWGQVMPASALGRRVPARPPVPGRDRPRDP